MAEKDEVKVDREIDRDVYIYAYGSRSKNIIRIYTCIVREMR